MSKSTSDSIESLLLTPKENKLVFQILGKGKKSLATAVAQLYLALPNDRTVWTKIRTGVVCLVKDKHEKSFFIRLLDIKEKSIVWEQELYKQFKYRAASKHFQTFFAHDCRAGINFANSEEAALFRAAVMERVNIFKKKRDEMRQRKMVAYQQQQQQQQQQMQYQMSQLAMQNPFFRMQNLMMMQMRGPMMAANQRAQLQAMFKTMTPEQKQAFIASFNRGMQGMTANMSGMQLVNQQQESATTLESSSTTSVDEPCDISSPDTPIQDTPSPPVPPPPPPAPVAPPPPPPPSAAPAPPPPGISDARAAGDMMVSSGGGGGDRGDLLQSIQAGAKLRKVDSSNPKKAIPKVESGMRGALARALDSRAKVLGDEESDEDEEWDDDDDDDWSD